MASKWNSPLSSAATRSSRHPNNIKRPGTGSPDSCGRVRTFLRICKAEERDCVARGGGADRFKGVTAKARDRCRNMRQIRRFVAARLRLGVHVSRQEIGCIGFDQQPLERDLGNAASEVESPALVAGPAGDADEEAEREVRLQFSFASGEAVGDSAVQPAGEIAQDRRKIAMRIALM